MVIYTDFIVFCVFLFVFLDFIVFLFVFSGVFNPRETRTCKTSYDENSRVFHGFFFFLSCSRLLFLLL